jgi:hypothetical protein
VQWEYKFSKLLRFGVSLKYFRTLCNTLAFFILIATGHVYAASPEISNFNLSDIDNQDISRQLSYFSTPVAPISA